MVIMKFINTINKILYTIEENDKYYITDQDKFTKRINEKSYHTQHLLMNNPLGNQSLKKVIIN